jgi:hypothetical protein
MHVLEAALFSNLASKRNRQEFSEIMNLASKGNRREFSDLMLEPAAREHRTARAALAVFAAISVATMVAITIGIAAADEAQPPVELALFAK